MGNPTWVTSSANWPMPRYIITFSMGKIRYDRDWEYRVQGLEENTGGFDRVEIALRKWCEYLSFRIYAGVLHFGF